MKNRREFLALASLALLCPAARAQSTTKSPPSSQAGLLTTTFFNFRDDVQPALRDQTIAALRTLAALPMVSGLMVARSLWFTDPAKYFEWILMMQFASGADRDAFAAHPVARQVMHDEFIARRGNHVDCELQQPLDAGYGNATGVAVRHTVLFNFKDSATPEARQRNVAAIRDMGQLPMVRRYVVGRNPAFTAGAGGADGATAMEWQVVGDFASEADYKAYATAPVHLSLRDDFTSNTSRVAWLDVKLADR